MACPLIGITTYGRDEENRHSLFAEYTDSVRRAGAEVVLLPPGAQEIDRWLGVVDGLVLTGGGDIHPNSYGGKAHGTHYMTDEERDRTEMDLTRRILESGLPTLAICRGAQLLNIVLGGTLYDHLPDVFGEQVKHRLPPREPTPHAITIEENSGLARVLRAVQFEAASWHHQAIHEPGDLLKVVAHAPDGVIEAVEKPDHPWLFAVQWHPELTAADDPIQQRLFDEHVTAAREGRKR